MSDNKKTSANMAIETIKNIIKALENTAKGEDVKMLLHYIDILDPTKLVTKKEVEKIVEEKIRKLTKEEKLKLIKRELER